MAVGISYTEYYLNTTYQVRLTLDACDHFKAQACTTRFATSLVVKTSSVVPSSGSNNKTLPQGMSAYTATSGTLSAVCGRISFTLGLKGPSVSVDTACSSSLVGAHLAVTSFLTLTCPRSAAVADGVLESGPV